ncbi:uncharacterized protein [Watersipora subatra]|uniref:uncharacterized protein n=1 Tax=Watersipora subatra TaxID=2589382 RepID=UPI00355C4415
MARLLLLCTVIYLSVNFFEYHTAACMKKEAPQPQTTTATLETTTLRVDVYASNCSSNDTFYRRCLNGGYCVVDINVVEGWRISRCQCDSTHEGSRCQNVIRVGTRTGSVYAVVGVAMLVFIVIVVAIAIIVHIRHKRSTERRQDSTSSSGSRNGVSHAQPAAQLLLNSATPQTTETEPPGKEFVMEVEGSV